MSETERTGQNTTINLLIFSLISGVCLYALFRQTPFETPTQWEGIDKAVHIALFASLTVHLLQWVKEVTSKWRVIIGISLFSLLSEWAQAQWLPQRNFSREDIIANMAGLFVGITIYWLWKKQSKSKVVSPKS